MDLLGTRILIRHRYQWEEIHDLIWHLYFKGTEKYVKSRASDYIANAREPFLAERPKIFYRYEESTKCYELKGRDTFDFEKNNRKCTFSGEILAYKNKFVAVCYNTVNKDRSGKNKDMVLSSINIK
jgi:hypothetical protein